MKNENELQPVAAQQHAQAALRGRVMDAVAEALGDAYDCLRVWQAWGVGTMGPDDFILVSDDVERIAEIADAAIAAMAAQQGTKGGM